MATGDLGRNLTFPIFNSDGTAFNDLVLHKATYDSVVMSLGDKITGDVYYRGTNLAVTMGEYVEYEGVKFVLVSPPTIVREGMVSDNSELKGLTKYSFTFYHPMYMLANFPFSDVAVSNDQKKYLSENKSFSWIGNLSDYVAKINKNIASTEWYCAINDNVDEDIISKLSDVLTFDNQSIADALKTGYETWEIPYTISTKVQTISGVQKKFLIEFGLPTTQIRKNNQNFVFEYGQGVGLKNNSRTPRNNKIITRIAGYGSEDNIPYGYPQVRWYGASGLSFTYGNAVGVYNNVTIQGHTFAKIVSYPIYKGILGGASVELIKHPFTRTHLMPSVYATSLFNKVSFLNANGTVNTNYNPDIELVDYYDAISGGGYTYPNPIVANAPSYEIHEFDKIKPELGSKQLVSVSAYDEKQDNSMSMSDFLSLLDDYLSESEFDSEKIELSALRESIQVNTSDSNESPTPQTRTPLEYTFAWSFSTNGNYTEVTYESSRLNFTATVRRSEIVVTPTWDDTMDDEGNYVQSYFKLTLPSLGFDLYACAAITQEMSINMRSGACIGCTFPIQVDWDDYKRNFYDEDGNFDPVIGTGHPRDGEKYPNSTSSSITVIVKKENTTFGTLMPNVYQQPATGDQFVILGISLPTSYITDAQERLDDDMKQYMLDNNVHYFDYPLKFDEYFLAQNTDILSQMKPNVVVQFKYNDETLALYIKQMTVKFGDKPLPEYNITLTDDVEIVLNPIGRVSDEVSNIKLLMGEGGGLSYDKADKRYLRKDVDDTAVGLIRLIRGLQVGDRFVTGLLGEGGIFRKEADGTTYLECDKMYVRMKAYFDTVEIRRYMHSGGNRIASAAGIKCTRVEYIDSNGSVTNDVSEAVKFRCYFNATDNDRTITNDFVVGDQAYCHETNVDTSSVDMHHYWRLVVAKSSVPNDNGEHWIDLANYYTNGLPSNMQWTNTRGETVNHKSHQEGSDVPIAQDDIIQLGSADDTTRMGAIIEFVTGADAPSYQIFQNIDDYSLEGKNYVSMGYASGSTSTHGEGHAYLEVYGDFFFGAQPDSVTGESPTFIKYLQDDGTGHPKLDIKANVEFTSPESTYGTSTLDAFIDAITRDVGNIQDQVDGNIESWFYDHMPVATDASGAPLNRVPLTNKEPYKTWYEADGGGTASEVTTERLKHLGDTFYDNTTGYAFRFSLNETVTPNVFEWVEIQDSAVIKALADAAKAQDTADHKRRVFVAQPAPVSPNNYVEYDVGDLWVNATGTFTYTESGQQKTITYDNDLLRCRVSKPIRDPETHAIINGIFSITDWELASKYTDDSKLLAFLDGYQGTLTAIQGQIDQKAETYYQDDDPSTNQWGSEHVGDMWFCTSDHADPSLYKLGTTWVWQEFVDEDDPEDISYAWAEAQIPQVVFDTLDRKKAVYVAWGAWIDSDNHNNLELRDLLIPAQDITPQVDGSDKTYYTDRIYRCVSLNPISFQEVDYVDDQTWSNWIQNTYNPNVSSIQIQIDGKAETWYQNTDPSSSWTTDAEKAKHVGDLWLVNIDVTGSNIYKAGTTWYYKDNGENANPRYTWDKQVVPQEVFDYADGKAAIFVGNTLPTDYHTNDMWFIGDGVAAANLPTGCIAGDVVVSSAESATYNKSHWAKKDRYTDDSKITRFVDILTNGSYTGGTIDFDAAAAAQYAIKHALNEGSTTVDGGLILSNIIALRDATSNIMSGLNGIYNASSLGGGIAAWYGGKMVDIEALTGSAKTTYDNMTAAQKAASKNYAKSLDRFDGSGYRASGNISWSDDGTLTIKGHEVDTTTLKINGTTVNLSDYLPKSAGSANPLTGDLYSLNILPFAPSSETVYGYSLGSQSRFWRNLFTKRIYLYKPNANDNDAVYLECDTDHNVKLVGNFYATGAVSALGSNSQQGGGSSVSLNEPLNGINTANIGAPTTSGQTVVWTGSAWVYSINTTLRVGALTTAGGATIYGNVESSAGNFIASAGHGFKITGGESNEVLLADGTKSRLKTVNGYSLFGDGNIDASGGGTGNYLPLAGGTMEGSINMATYYIGFNGSLITSARHITSTGSERDIWIYEPYSRIVMYAATYLHIQPNTRIGYNYSTTTTPTYPLEVNGSVYASSFIKESGTSGQFLKADGSVDSTAYYPKSGGEINGMCFVKGTILDINRNGNTGQIGNTSNAALEIECYTDRIAFKSYHNSSNGGKNFVFQNGNVIVNTALTVYGQLTSGVADGTAPFVVTSTTLCSNLNADMLDGQHSSYFATADSLNSYYLKTGGKISGSVGIRDVFDINRDGTTGTIFDETKTALEIEAYAGFVAFKTYSKTSSVSKNFAFQNGNVGIGTSSPSYNLHVNGTLYASGNSLISGTLGVGGQITSSVASGTAPLSITSTTLCSNLNADMLDGQHSSYFATAASLDNYYLKTGGKISGRIALTDVFDINRDGSTGEIFNTTKTALEIEAYAGFIGFKTYSSSSSINKNFYFATGNVGIGTSSPSEKLEVVGNAKFAGYLSGVTNVDSLLYFDTTNSRVGVNTSSPSTSLHVKGRVTCEYDSTALGSFCALRGNYQSYFGINSSGYLIFTTGQSGQSTSTVRMSFTPYTATEHYALLPHNLRVAGSGDNTSFTDGGYVQIGEIKLAYDSTNNAIKVIKYDGSAANFYATGAVSALGANTSSGGAGDYIPLSGSSNISGSLIPSATNTYNLGSSSKHWGTIYCNAISGNASLSVQDISCTTLSAGAKVVLSYGAKMYSICFECNSDGGINTGHAGEINRFGGDLHLQYDSTSGASNQGGVTLAQQAFKFYKNSGSAFLTTNNLHFQVNTGNGNPYINKAWNVTSDMRKKDIVKYVDIDIQRIADAPVFDFTLKDDATKELSLGSSAQYWDAMLPSAIRNTPDGYLCMDYSSIALVSAVLTARKVVDHERRIKLLEVENEALRKEIEQLKKAA